MRDLARLARQVRVEVKADNLSLVAAGVAFYGLLAIFPAIIATVAVYGLVADPDHISAQLASATEALPQEAADLIVSQLSAAAKIDRSGLTLGLVLSLGATLWAATGGVRALLNGLNVIYDVKENRGFVRRSALALGLTVGGLVTVAAALALVAAFPVALDRVGLEPVAAGLAEAARWLLLVILILLGLALLYRWGPARPTARRRWVTWGSAGALLVWILGSIAFSVYVANFGSYNKTYGTIAAVIVLMLWLYVSAFSVLLGAEIDAVRERDKSVTPTTPEVV